MRRVINSLLVVTVCVLALLLMAQRAQSQGLKIGFVNDERIKVEYKAWQLAQEQWELEAKAWEEEALAKQTDLNDLEDEYEKQKLILSEEKKKEKEAAIKVKAEDLDSYTRRIFGPNGEAERKQAQLLQPLLEKVTQAIEAVAVEANYDVVFTLQSGLGYIKESYDLTDKVLEYLEENE
jgi:outer membrane protein